MSLPHAGFDARKANRHAHYLSRKQSLRNLNLSFDSFDAPPNESEFIYNAENVRTDELQSRTSEFSCTEPFPLSTRLQPKLLVDFGGNKELDFLASHSRWPTSHLEPIIERRSKSEVHQCSFVPQLQPSPERSSKIIRSKVSARSVHPLEGPQSPIRKHTHSFSLNDLDCLPRSDTKKILHQNWDDSSSEEDALNEVRCRPSFPLKPTYAQPYRSPTPPGLPSFGTREAQEYRLSPPSVSSRALLFMRKVLSRLTQASMKTPSVQPDTAPTAPQTQDRSAPVTMLRKSLGTSHPICSPPRHAGALRAPLPLNVRVVATPGALVQADDGTLVRGRWGPRFSGHGVGQRGLSAHPLTRITGLHSIDEVVMEMDKTSQAADEEHRRCQAHNAQLFLSSEQNPGGGIPAFRLRYERSQRSSIDAAEFTLQGVSPRTAGSPHQGISSTISTVPSRTIQQQGPGMVTSRNSDCQDTLAGSQIYAQRDDCELVRQNLLNKPERSYLKDCWEELWSFCDCYTSRRQQNSEGQ